MKRMLMVATVSSMIGQFNMNNLQILKDLGYQPYVACNFKDTSVWTEERIHKFICELKENNIPYYQIDFSRNPLDIKKDFSSYKQLSRLVKKGNYAFIHCHTPVASIIARIVAHNQKIKVIYTAHGFHFYKGAPLKNWMIYYPIEKFFSRWTDVLITINKEDYNRAKGKFCAKKVVYIPGVGLDTEKYRICHVDKTEKRTELGLPKNAFLLFSVEEFQNYKESKNIIEALCQINNPNIYYLVISRGKIQEKYESLIQKYNLNNNVKFLEFRTDIDELCETADCFFHSFFREELDIASLEAMARGLPFIFSCIDSIRDYTEDRVSGCCIKYPLSIDELVYAINTMYSDRIFRMSCGINNLNTAKNFNIANINEIMNRLNVDYGCSHVEWLIKRQRFREELGFKLNDFVIISVGEVNANKNQCVIIDALEKINDERVKYIICGKGNLEETYKKKIKELGLEKRVMLLGFQADIKSYLQMSDVFAFPSKREGLGLAAIEAMACGLPLITSNIHGIKDYSVDGVSGCSVKENSSADAMSKAIEKLYHDKTFRITCGINNQHKAREFDEIKTNEIMRQLYITMRE